MQMTIETLEFSCKIKKRLKMYYFVLNYTIYCTFVNDGNIFLNLGYINEYEK